MTQNLKIYIAGHSGMVGGALLREFKKAGYTNLVYKTHRELDLCDEKKTEDFISREKPGLVVLAAARVGGIRANNSQRANFIFENLKIQNNVIWSSFKCGVPHLIFLGSSCVYPRIADREILEEDLLNGYLEYTNRPYAVAKIAGLELINSLNEQHGTKYFALNPTNVYGPGDHYDELKSHVIPALIMKFHKAKLSQQKEVAIMGSGRALREFILSDDLARIVVRSFEERSKIFEKVFPLSDQRYYHFNVGTGQEHSIRDLAQNIAQVVGYSGQITFGDSKDDGTPKKRVNLDRFNQLFAFQATPLKVGLESAYTDYQHQLASNKS